MDPDTRNRHAYKDKFKGAIAYLLTQYPDKPVGLVCHPRDPVARKVAEAFGKTAAELDRLRDDNPVLIATGWDEIYDIVSQHCDHSAEVLQNAELTCASLSRCVPPLNFSRFP